MNKIIGCVLLFMFSSLISTAQNIRRDDVSRCGSDEIMAAWYRNNPGLKVQMDSLERQSQGSRHANRTGLFPPSGSIIVPVVVYIVHDATFDVSDQQVADQMSAMNSYFLNTGLKFCLAPSANGSAIPVNTGEVQTTPGIIHITNASLTVHNSATQQQALVNTANSLVTKDRYLRIWVVKSINGPSVLGYSMYPNSSPIFDGVVMRYDVFGNGSGNLLANYNMGKVLVHEVGHYLWLYHPWEGGCNNADPYTDGDRVWDTPAINGMNFNCNSTANSCPETPAIYDDVSNYMDYTNDNCRSHFSAGQIDRLLNSLSTYKSTLYSSDNLLYTRACWSAGLVSATITPSSYAACAGSSGISFSAIGGQASYLWNFGDAFAGSGNLNTSSIAAPSHIYTSAANSPYTVTLTVTNSSGQTAFSSIQIYVSNCMPISNSQSYWYVEQNKGLNFNSGIPVFDTSFPPYNVTRIGCGSQATAAGDLLFYTDGKKIWNGQHAIMNSVDLISSTNIGLLSDAILIVPKPPQPGFGISEYLIFTNYLFTSPQVDEGFRYSVINAANLSNPVMGAFRQPVTLAASYGFNSSTFDGAVTGGYGTVAIKKCNNNDYWIITGVQKGVTDYLVVFSLTSSGLTYVSETLFPTAVDYGVISLKMAPNGNKLICYSGYGYPHYLYDFNKADGSISSSYSTLPAFQCYSAAFSPDSKLLYMLNSYGHRIVQYNLNSANVQNTEVQIGSAIEILWCIEAGPDNKIYVSTNNNHSNLAVIHNPNALATQSNPNACNFSANGPMLPLPIANSNVVLALPNMIDAKDETAYFGANVPEVISAYITGCKSYKFFPNICGATFNWKITNTLTGAVVLVTVTDLSYTFLQNGTYIITLMDTGNVVLGSTAPIIISDMPSSTITGSTNACTAVAAFSVTSNSTVLAAGDIALWTVSGGTVVSPSNNQSSVDVRWTSLPGTLTLTVTTAAGCSLVQTQTITAVCPCNCLSSLVINSAPQVGGGYNYSVNNTSVDQICPGLNLRYRWTFADSSTQTTTTNQVFSAGQTISVIIELLASNNTTVLCSVTGTYSNLSIISQDSVERGVRITPNPSKGLFTIQIRQFIGKVDIEVVDMNGRVVYDERGVNFDNEKTVDLSALQVGIYALRINGEEIRNSEKLIRE